MNKANKIKVAVGVILLVVSLLVIFNFQTVKDFFKASSFQPSEKLLAVESSLDLTDHGKLIFRATSPSLDSRDDFNKVCSAGQSEASILGCYVADEIHVFDVESKEFSGIVESTSAHELLHAVWMRMDDREKSDLTPVLKSVYDSGSTEFKKTVDLYDSSAKLEEIYVRSATQIRDLPENLEKHFSTIFKNQDSLVGFYESYISPFSELEKAINSLSEELSSLKQKIEEKTNTYASQSEAFAGKVSEFNSCASTPNCFTNSTFSTRRAELLREQSDLNALYGSLDADISAYNQKIDVYNEKVIYGKNLQNIINSNPKPKESV